MTETEIIETNTDTMQRYLVTLRKLAGWSATELAEKIGITKQSLCALEKVENERHTKMSRVQYLALYGLFATQASLNDEKGYLKRVLNILFTDTEYYCEHKDDIDETLMNLPKLLATDTPDNLIDRIISYCEQKETNLPIVSQYPELKKMRVSESINPAVIGGVALASTVAVMGLAALFGSKKR